MRRPPTRAPPLRAGRPHQPYPNARLNFSRCRYGARAFWKRNGNLTFRKKNRQPVPASGKLHPRVDQPVVRLKRQRERRQNGRRKPRRSNNSRRRRSLLCAANGNKERQPSGERQKACRTLHPAHLGPPPNASTGLVAGLGGSKREPTAVSSCTSQASPDRGTRRLSPRLSKMSTIIFAANFAGFRLSTVGFRGDIILL